MKFTRLALIFFLTVFQLHSQNLNFSKGKEAITFDAVQGQLEFLSSDWMEGRETGKEGQFMAADYIASMFKVYGIKPFGDKTGNGKSYFQDFNLVEYEAGPNQVLTITKTGNIKQSLHLNYKTDFTVRTTDIPQEVDSRIVFAGYGYKNEEQKYNDFEDVDVKGKVVIILRGFPGHNDKESEAYKKFAPEDRWGFYRIERTKTETLKELGAAAIIQVNTNHDAINNMIANYPFRYNTRYYEGTEKLSTREKSYEIIGNKFTDEIPVISLSTRALNKILEENEIDIEEFENTSAKNIEPQSKILKNIELHLKTDVISRVIKTRNVLGMIEGVEKDSIVVVGAHYDHEGMRKGIIYNGADDNASGTVGVMTLAKAFMTSGQKPQKTIVFAAWSGEERGLLGSNYFMMNPPKEHVVFYLNFDMIGRDDNDDVNKNRTMFSYNSNYPIIIEMTEKYNQENNYNIEFKTRPSEHPVGGSDFTAFTEAGVPIANYITSLHDDYHTPLDHEDKINYDKMMKIIYLGYHTMWDVANAVIYISK